VIAKAAGGQQVYKYSSARVWHTVTLHRLTNGLKGGCNSFRFDDLPKKLGLQIWINTGTRCCSLARRTRACSKSSALVGTSFYKFLHGTLLEGGLPSLTTIKSFCEVYIKCPLHEFGYQETRFLWLQNFLERIGYKERLLLAHTDAVAIIPRVRYRPLDDAVFGHYVPDDEMPTTDLRMGSSANVLLAKLQKHGLATEAEVLSVGPLDPAAPRFVLAVMPQKKGGKATALQNRWRTLERCLQAHQYYLVSIGADGGGANISAQRKYMTVRSVVVVAVGEGGGYLRLHNLQATADEKCIVLSGFPALSADGRTIVDDRLVIPCVSAELAPGRFFELPQRRCTSDPAHLAKKLTNAVSDSKLEFAPQVPVTLEPLRQLFKDTDTAIAIEAKVGLRESDLARADRQNFRSAQRLLAGAVQVNLRNREDKTQVTSMHALIGFLVFANAVLESYLRPDLSTAQRVEKSCYAYTFAMLWQKNLWTHYDNKGWRAHFISDNAFQGLRINAQVLFTWVIVLLRLPAEIRKKIPLAPWLFGSQVCEEFFRLLRQMIGYENFDAYDLLKRLNRLLAASLLKAEGVFKYPESRKAWHFDEIHKKASPIESDLTEAMVIHAARRGSENAIKDFAMRSRPLGPIDVPAAPPPTPAPASPEPRNEEELCSDDDTPEADSLEVQHVDQVRGGGARSEVPLTHPLHRTAGTTSAHSCGRPLREARRKPPRMRLRGVSPTTTLTTLRPTPPRRTVPRHPAGPLCPPSPPSDTALQLARVRHSAATRRFA
jgi:hypothetical protein